MSYIDPGYYEHAITDEMEMWTAYRPEYDTIYYAVEYADGWFSVDGDEWVGEFPNREAAEDYLHVIFSRLLEGDTE